ncbi:UPF0182 family protein [Luteimicrobium subarcticum]|uniref:UPF0182 protein CLV34_0585 n=1 Tax=Luteimicrobium subarcticum TaxID=620910 RepID=A0A2M8WV07_9MICO|nr:UPF0182 family protein [Luteimicrobium subarcticum]PJI94738.1 hypothetical protein CLV34_0585 [Luteimicrobium subarcticum]
MSFAPPSRPSRSGASAARRRSPLLVTLVVLVLVVIAVVVVSRLGTEVLWFDQVGYSNVLWTQWLTRGVLFLLGFLLMAGCVWLSITLAYRNRPIYAPSTPEQATLDQYREAIEPLRRVVTWGLPVLLGLFAGAATSGAWKTVQLAMHSVSFGVDDPQFHKDVSFYVFTLPFLRFVVGFLVAVAILSVIVAVATHYLYGGLRVGGAGGKGLHTTSAARVQLAVTGAVLLLLVAANYWLDRYSLMSSNGDKFAGAGYTDVNAVLPAKAILAGIAVIVALLFVLTAVRGDWRLPGIGLGLMVVAAIAIGGIYPAVVQRFQVNPNEQSKETPYIQRNIDATKAAYGLTDVDDSLYSATTEAKSGALSADARTTTQIRLLDPQVVSPSFRQIQQIKQYYNFPDTLAVDRYTIDGKSQDTVIAARELDLSGLGAGLQNWVNDHTVYTHGYGLVAAYGNTTTSDGKPSFFEKDIPTKGSLGDYEPRIYFGQGLPDYSIVGAPQGTDPWELDYPDDEGGQVNSTFSGDGGPDVGSLARKVMYAIRFGSEQILFSDRVTSDSQILYDRDPRERVHKVAPYLTLDGRSYPAVVDGRVQWIVDGYTTTDGYPYAARTALDAATSDAVTARSQSIEALAPQQVDYIRNSVKATVDAYDGHVTLYAFDPDDPVLKAWSKVFPSTIEPLSKMSGDLMSHVRYPEDLFKVQRTLLTRYHVDDAAKFFGGQDFWKVPDDPSTTGEATQQLQPPYYLTLQMPDQDSPSFSLTSTFVPGGTTDRQILTGFLSADADAGSTAGKVSPDYGKLRLLELPRNSSVPGPGQAQNNFNSDPAVANDVSLLKQGNSDVILGNLLTLPVGGGLVYVQPVYVQSKSGTAYPLLRNVLVGFGDKVGYAGTLDEALDQVFGGNSGATAGDADNAGKGGTAGGSDTGGPDTGGGGTSDGSDATASAQAQLDAALSEANQALKEGQAALAKSDFTAYGEAQQRLQQAVEDATAASDALDKAAAGSAATSTPTPTPTPTGG